MSKGKYIFLALLLLLLFSGVADAQLMNSAWAKFHHDLNNSGQSPYASNSDGTLKWNFTTSSFIYSSPAIDSNGVVYVGAYNNKLYAIYPNGTEKWNFTTDSFLVHSGAIAHDGVIYIGDYSGKLYAINSNGTSKWNFTIDTITQGEPAIALDGTIYTGSQSGVLYAINSNGTSKWNFTTNLAFQKSTISSVDSNGIIYFGTSYLYNDKKNLFYALYPNGTEKWNFSFSPYNGVRAWASSMIDSNGIIYFADEDSIFHAIYPNGTEKWSINIHGWAETAPTIDTNGIIYTSNSGSSNNFYAIYPNGTVKWNITLRGTTRWSDPIVDMNNIIYVGSSNNFSAIYPNGTEKWNITFSQRVYSPAIASDGTIYIGTLDGNLYAFASPSPTTFDPSGYVNDTNGNFLINAKVVLSNATFNTTAYTDANGYWNTNIYADGTYNYNVSLNGYTTLSGSQTFVMGGTNNNFTMTAGQGRVYGTVYEYTNESGSKSIVGDLKSIKQIFAKAKKGKLSVGSTFTLGLAPDGKTYVLKGKDIDASGNQFIIGILQNGAEVDSEIVGEYKDYRWKVSETQTTELYITVHTDAIFAGGDVQYIEITAGYDVRQKTSVSLWDVIFIWVNYFSSNTANIQFFIDLINWLSFASDKPETKVTFNASSNFDAEAETIMDFSSDTNPTTYFLTIRTKNDGTQGKIGYGFTDDNIETPPNYKDIYIATGENQYLSDYRKFSDTDTNGNKKIKVWLYFYSGYGSKWDFNYFVTAFCTGCNLKPLADATVYQSFINNTKSSATGYYNLFVPFGTYNISYFKDGYESKSISFTFNATNNINNTNIVLNKSTTQIINPEHYIKVLPDPSTVGTSISAYYKTLNTYSYYRISICPFNDEANCLDIYDSDSGVAPNKESFVALKNYPIGTYSAYLSGKDLFDWSWSPIVMTNFTRTSDIPTASWEASTYYLGDTMKINIYIPNGFQTVTAYYPNGTTLYSGNFSAATTVQNVTFVTTINSTAGKYKTQITGNNNISITELMPISANEYNLTAPSSIQWGKSFTVQYVSPKTSELTITKSDGSLAFQTKTVVGSKSVTFNTSSLENKADTLTVQLVQNNVVKKEIKIKISSSEAKAAWSNNPTDSGYTAGIIDSQVSLLGMGVNNTSRFLFAMIWTIIFLVGGFAVTGNNPSGGLYSAMLPLGFFTSLSFIQSGVEFFPKYFVIIIAFIIVIKTGIVK